MALIAHALKPLLRPSWERLYELFAPELEAAEQHSMAGRPQLARPHYQKILDALAHEADISALEAEYLVTYQQNPKHTAAMNFLAFLQVVQGEWEKGAALWKKSLAVATNQPDILYNLGCIASALGRFEEAIAAFSYLLHIVPQQETAALKLAQCYVHLGRFEEASGVLDEVLGAVPVTQDALVLRIDCANALGDGQLTAALCRQALALFPHHGHFLLSLCAVETLSPHDPLVVDAVLAEGDATLPPQERARLGFALYRVYEAAGQGAQAFAYLQAANQRLRQAQEWDAAAVALQCATIKAFAPQPLLLEALPRATDVTPVFLVGMPLSGMAALEQVLARHPSVHLAGGRQEYLPRLAYAELLRVSGLPYPHALPRLQEMDASTLGALREHYLSRLRAHDGSAKFIVDSLPMNAYFIGLIRSLFPEAKIIYCEREGLANCFDLYRGEYAAEALPYGNDFMALANARKELRSLMQHWLTLYGEAIHTVSYEAWAANLQTQAQALLSYCGLPWDAAVLSAENDAGQSSHPRSSDPTALWKTYEKELEELKKLLKND